MTGYPYRSLFVWIAALALFWLAACSPWSTTWNTGIAVAVLLGTCLALAVATRRIRTRRVASQQVLAAVNGALHALPGHIRRNTPLVLAMGEPADTLTRVFGGDVVQITDAAIWVRVDEPARLKHIADALKRWRGGQGPDAVAYLVDADSSVNQANLTAATQCARVTIDEASRAVGYRLPVCVAVYVAEVAGSPMTCPWFGVSGSVPSDLGTLAGHIAVRASLHARWVSEDDRTQWTRRAARLDAAARWAAAALLPGLAVANRTKRTADIEAFGVTALQGLPASVSLIGRYVEALSALRLPSSTGAQARLPLPDTLLSGIALQPVRRPQARAIAHAFVAFAGAFCAAAVASAWQNQALITRIQANMARYQAISPAQNAARLDALAAIKRDRDELERYARAGVPPRLGLGFYRAGAMLPAINTLIASYQPPEPPPPMIELSSLSLFKSGSAQLNPGSNRVMFDALELIKKHPNKRVLVAGHTDTVGNPRANQRLSEARAASVRDWLADASGIALSQFAIQGYGDTRPKASNDTDVGRAANRRVEITLIPDCRDAQSTDLSPGLPACSFE